MTGLHGDRLSELVPTVTRKKFGIRLNNLDMPATIDSMVNNKQQISSAKSEDVLEASEQQPDSRATHVHTSERERGNNVGDVVFASKDYLRHVK